jgi:type II secretory pathway component PulM
MDKLWQTFIVALAAQWARLRKYVSGYIAPLSARVRTRYRKLESREKAGLVLAGFALGGVLAYYLVVQPLYDTRSELDSEVARRRHDLVEVVRMVQTYKTLQQEVVAAQNRALAAGKDFSLFSVLEAKLSQGFDRSKITSISPNEKKLAGELMEHRVDLKLENIDLAQIVEALYKIEHLSPPVIVSELRIKKHPNNPHAFDVDLSCFAVGKAG